MFDGTIFHMIVVDLTTEPSIKSFFQTNMKRINFAPLFLLTFLTIHAVSQTTPFNYTGAVQSYTVPACVYYLTVDVRGAAGSAVGTNYSAPGKGGRVQATFTVTPGEVLNIYVGESPAANIGGWNGGGDGGTLGGGGGGSSDIRRGGTALSNRIIVAGGGGGGGYDNAHVYVNTGGQGGGLTGGNGVSNNTTQAYSGLGGTQLAGGAGGTGSSGNGSSGSLGTGGSADPTQGGGGGGGYYGGGGGTANLNIYGGGGGGGSSYAISTVTNLTHTQGFQNGNGQIIITAVPAPKGPGLITGQEDVCSSTTEIYSIRAVANTNSYAWTVTGTGNTVSGTDTLGSVSWDPTFSGNAQICVSALSACGTSTASCINVAVYKTPEPPLVNNVTICSNTTATITATATADLIKWYDLPAGGNLLFTGNTYSTSPLSSDTTYYVQAVNLSSDKIISTEAGLNYVGTSGVASNGTITFVIENSNSFPVVLKGVDDFFQSGQTNTMCDLWYSATSLSGAPSISSPIWTNIATSGPHPIPTDGYYVIFTGLNFTIPANTTYRFAIQSSNGIRYTGPASAPSPSQFTKAGVKLLLGDIQIGGQVVGYGGAFPDPVNNPRWFTGRIAIGGIASCVSARVPVDINVSVPVADAGPDTDICVGDSTQLNAGGGTTYLWSTSVGLSDSTVANPMAGPVATITYTVTITDANNCSASDDVTVNVNPIPVANAGADITLCMGDSAAFNATGGTLYAWSQSAGLSCTNCSNPVASPAANTTYTVTVTDSNACSATDDIFVTVNPAPVANAGTDITICATGNTLLNASGGISYSWSPPGGLSDPSISNPVASPVSSTNYTVTVTNANNCADHDEVLVFVDSCIGTGISFLSSELVVSVTPNPSHGVLTLSINDPGAYKITIEVVNPQGQSVYRKQTDDRQPVIDISEVPAGIYFLKLISGSNEVIRKIIVQ